MSFLFSFRTVLGWRRRRRWLLSLFMASLLSSVSFFLRFVLAYILLLLIMVSNLRLLYWFLGSSWSHVLNLLLLVTLLSTWFRTSPACRLETILNPWKIWVRFINWLLSFIVSVSNGISLVSTFSQVLLLMVCIIFPWTEIVRNQGNIVNCGVLELCWSKALRSLVVTWIVSATSSCPMGPLSWSWYLTLICEMGLTSSKVLLSLFPLRHIGLLKSLVCLAIWRLCR